MKFFTINHKSHFGMTLDDSNNPDCLVWEMGCLMPTPMRWEVPVSVMTLVDSFVVYQLLGDIYEMEKLQKEMRGEKK